MISLGGIGGLVRQGLIVLTILGLLTGCSTLQHETPPQPPKQNLFIVFFVPGTVRLAPEAQQIVQQAAWMALQGKVWKIEIAVPRDAPGGAQLIEGRITSIENILSAAHVDQKLLASADLSDAAVSLPGAADRGEIRLLPKGPSMNK
jgi:hypothetical protein